MASAASCSRLRPTDRKLTASRLYFDGNSRSYRRPPQFVSPQHRIVASLRVQFGSFRRLNFSKDQSQNGTHSESHLAFEVMKVISALNVQPPLSFPTPIAFQSKDWYQRILLLSQVRTPQGTAPVGEIRVSLVDMNTGASAKKINVKSSIFR